MIIETQLTPDDNVINFFAPEPLLRSGTAEFADTKSLRKSPLAEKLFDLGGIASLFISNDMVSVTKEENIPWDMLKPQIMAEIMDYLSTGEDVLVETSDNTPEDEIIGQIKGLLNARIRPAVKKDGGDIEFKYFKDGIVYVEMQGSCKGCPYAMVTLKEGVEKILKDYIPVIKEVRNIQTPE
ncbi:MAG: NifU family protein [Alphaproteobacteria bacterium]|nr:NifU family protein [Alphaproteobacteria bacterium]